MALAMMPLAVCLGFSAFGLFLLWHRRIRAAKIFLLLGILSASVLSFNGVANHIIRPLEAKYPPLLESEDLHQIKWVVVLGGGQNFAPELPANSMLENSSLSRLIEGIRIHRMLPDSKLVLSGGGVFDTRPEAVTMANVAMILGVDPAALVVETLSKDTQDQAYQLRKMLGQTPIILVTSASHMPRAMLVFENAGLRPTPAPVDFSDWRRSHYEPGDFFPRAKELKKVESALHEYLGILWVRLNWSRQ